MPSSRRRRRLSASSLPTLIPVLHDRIPLMRLIAFVFATCVFATCVSILTSLRAADPAGFDLWRAGELNARQKALASRVGPDKSARETLGEYGGHRARLIHRTGDGAPEQHDRRVDIWIVQSGEGTLVLGGKMLDSRPGGSEGEFVGSGIEGGERHAVAAGDIVHIPVRVPHRVLVQPGKQFTYVNLRLLSDR